MIFEYIDDKKKLHALYGPIFHFLNYWALVRQIDSFTICFTIISSTIGPWLDKLIFLPFVSLLNNTNVTQIYFVLFDTSVMNL